MENKIYIKRGKRNYKENKLIAKIQEAMSKNPNIANEITPATNFEDLKSIHDKYVIEDVHFEETISNNNKKQQTEQNMNDRNNKNNQNDFDETEKENSFIDPLNREEPIVRDYVLEDELKETKVKENSINGNNKSQKTFFDEPTTFSEQFEIPDYDENSKNSNSSTFQNSNNSNGGNQKTNRANKADKQPSPPPINPQFETMSEAKKRRSSKRFAKYIVETICMLSEKGFVWYANKDINEAKLTEYEASGEMDLSLLVSLDENQQCTVKHFFQEQCSKSEELSKIDIQEKEDLAAALELVLMEKGVAPTPMQELILIGLKIFGEKAVMLMSLKSQTNSLLTQLREMKSGSSIDENQYQYQQQQSSRQAYREYVQQNNTNSGAGNTNNNTATNTDRVSDKEENAQKKDKNNEVSAILDDNIDLSEDLGIDLELQNEKTTLE